MEQSSETKVPETSAEDQAKLTLKAIEVQYKGLLASTQLHIRTLLNMLTSRGINGNLQKQIKDSIERAIVAAIDYGVDIEGKEAKIRLNGTLGKLESSLAMQMAKAKECGIVLMSQKLENETKERNEKNGEKNDEKNDESETKTN